MKKNLVSSPVPIFFKKNNFIVLKKFKKNKAIFVFKNNLSFSKIISLVSKKGLKIAFLTKFVNVILSNKFSEKKFNEKLIFLFGINSLNLNFKIIEHNIIPTNFLFSFIAANLDKKRKKNSRGKLPQIFFLWKFVPPYKRANVFLKILIKEIKFIKENTWRKKLLSFFNILLENKFKYVTFYQNFINNLVFKKYMGSLFNFYRTIK